MDIPPAQNNSPVWYDSVDDRLMTGLQSAVSYLQGIGQLQGISAAYIRSWPFRDQIYQYPCIVISFEDESEIVEDGNFEQDYPVYPIRVWILDRWDQDDTTLTDPTQTKNRRSLYQGWRQQLAEYLRGLGLGGATIQGVPECWDVDVKYRNRIDVSDPDYQFFMSGLVVHCKCTRQRIRQL